MTKTVEILIIDDDRMSLMLLRHQLVELGYQAEGLTSGTEGLALLDRQPDRFDIIVLDRMMPGLDGIAMTHEIAKRDHLNNIPIIMVTGADSAEEMKEGIDAGVFYYLAKPVKKALVQSVVSAAMRQKKLSSTVMGGADGTPAFGLIEGAKFSFRTVEEAELLAGFVANTFPDPQRTVGGAAALFLNAVEHGICEIGYEEKGELLRDGRLQEMIDARLAAAPDAKAHAVVAVKPNGYYLSVSDPGPGFSWKEYDSFDVSLNEAGHGRGIVRAKTEAFDKLVFQGAGNTVTGFVGRDTEIRW